MKRYWLSPLCSALLVPGMGQLLNRHAKKGLILIAIVFLLLIAATYEFFKLIWPLCNPGITPQIPATGMVHYIWQQDLSSLRFILLISTLVWLYSIIDAWIYGRRLEKKTTAQKP